MDRRKFMQIGGLGGSGALLGSYLQACGPRALVSGQQTAEGYSVSIPAPRGSRDRLNPEERDSNRVCIVGGGIAGLSAALELVERNFDVTLFESEAYLGGRLHTRQEYRAGQKFGVEHGLHMWFYQYYNFKNTLDRLGVLDTQFKDFNEVYFEFKPPLKPEIIRSEGPYPINMMNILRTSPNLGLLNAAGTLGAMKDVVFFNYENVYKKFDNITFEDWMTKARVDQKFRDVVMRPAASVTLNDPMTISAAEMIMYQHLYFIGHPKAFHRKVTKTDHETAVIAPWADRIQKLGGKVLVNNPIKALQFSGDKVTGIVKNNGEFESYNHVILALDVPGLHAVLKNSYATDEQAELTLKAMQSKIRQMKVAPPYSVLRVWFDKPTAKDRPFTKSVVETSEYRPINLLAIMSMLEAPSAEWATRTGGSIVEYHLYNTPELVGLDAEAIWNRIGTTALPLTPELHAAGAKPVDFSLGQFHNFTSFDTGQGEVRPLHDYPSSIGISNLGLCGDCIATTYPSALMERALSTGREAANFVAQKLDVKGVELEVATSRGPGIIPQF